MIHRDAAGPDKTSVPDLEAVLGIGVYLLEGKRPGVGGKTDLVNCRDCKRAAVAEVAVGAQTAVAARETVVTTPRRKSVALDGCN
jgi:hypothetical protein